MGLTAGSTGMGAVDHGLVIRRGSPEEKVIALAGNPNVGKSTVFNALTGMNQHTGNWPGKTVSCAQGTYEHAGEKYLLVDLPGTYSLAAHSREEEAARDFLCFGGADAAVVVCDATCLERNLNLALQTIEIQPRTVLCVNLMDEAEKKGIRIDFKELERLTGVPAVAVSARSGKGLERLMQEIARIAQCSSIQPQPIVYGEPIDSAAALVERAIRRPLEGSGLNPRWAALRLLERDSSQLDALGTALGVRLEELPDVSGALEQARKRMSACGVPPEHLEDILVRKLVRRAERISKRAVISAPSAKEARDRRLDRILTGKHTGIPIMLLLLALIFWITIVGANYPSELLSSLFARGGEWLSGALVWLGAPDWLESALVSGVYGVLTRVVAVMLPPMAIFFPMFTLLENSGYLPRIAFNLDKYFKSCSACGKQGLTMAMGFGCNTVGITGCRIIDSPRERLIAVLTNNFVPCNGRFPGMIAMVSVMFAGGGLLGGVMQTLVLTGVILMGIGLTFLTSKLLSKTLLRGEPSSFTLELPPYRRPQIVRVLVRSIFDRTLFVLGRAAAVAAPAGLLLWILANVQMDGRSLLAHGADSLDPLGRLLGMDGTILLSFVLGFPANEIVIPVMLMTYLAQGSLTDMGSTAELGAILAQNGWTWLTAVCTILFFLMHWPCSTACITIWRETRSLKWTIIAVLLPTLCGMICCALVAGTARILGLVPY